MGNYRKLNLDTYYRKGVYERFTKVARCSVSITSRIDVTGLYEYSTFYAACQKDIEYLVLK